MFATGRDGLAVLRRELVREFLERGMAKGGLARADSKGRVPPFLHHALERVNGQAPTPIRNDLDVSLSTHVNVFVLCPRAASASRRV